MGLGDASERLRTIWKPEMDRYFIDLMLEQVAQGRKFEDHLFSKRAWKHMSLKFNAKFNFQYEKDVLKNRHKTLRNLYRGIKNLLAQPGFSWDEKRNMVIADNHVWDEYLTVSKFEIILNCFNLNKRSSIVYLLHNNAGRCECAVIQSKKHSLFRRFVYCLWTCDGRKR